MDTSYGQVPTIIVEWSAVQAHNVTGNTDDSDFVDKVNHWLLTMSKDYDLVVFVQDPKHDDFDQSKVDWQPSAVIRNSRLTPLPPIAFVTTAFVTLKDGSAFFPVWAVTTSAAATEMYEEGGVLGTTAKMHAGAASVEVQRV